MTPNHGNTNDNKPDIDTLLAAENKNHSIIELDNYICQLCEWGDSLEKLTDPQKNFYYNQELEREVNNGGFNQYFSNSSGNYAHQTVISLQAIGAANTVRILQTAIAQFPNNIVPADREIRQEILEQIEEKASEAWELLEQLFFYYEDNLNELNLEYVKQHRDAF